MSALTITATASDRGPDRVVIIAETTLPDGRRIRCVRTCTRTEAADGERVLREMTRAIQKAAAKPRRRKPDAG